MVASFQLGTLGRMSSCPKVAFPTYGKSRHARIVIATWKLASAAPNTGERSQPNERHRTKAHAWALGC